MAQMKSFVDLDWVTFVCPCGSQFCTRYDADPTKWLTKHKPHTDDTCLQTVTDDGARCLVSKPNSVHSKRIT